MTPAKSWQVLVKMRTHDGRLAVRTRVDLVALDPGLACVSAFAVAKRDALGQAATDKAKLPKIAAISFLVRPAPEVKS